MLEQDYLMRMILVFFESIRKSWEEKEKEKDPLAAADTLEAAVGTATDMDGDLLLSLAPESIAQVMQVSGVDPRVTEYIARGLLLESSYLEDGGDMQRAELRAEQARAIAAAYGFDLPASFSTADEAVAGMETPAPLSEDDGTGASNVG
jgi:hypothetical protein